MHKISRVPRKHRKRHTKPFGCVSLNCSKNFGAKVHITVVTTSEPANELQNDWVRHDNGQHGLSKPGWYCNMDDTSKEAGKCGRSFHHKAPFETHLRYDHHVTDNHAIGIIAEDCSIGKNDIPRYWCGFCVKSLLNKKRDPEAYGDKSVTNERIEHINQHFSKGLHADDWVHWETNKTRKAMEKETKDRVSDSAYSSSQSEMQPEYSSPIAEEVSSPRKSRKRKHSDGNKFLEKEPMWGCVSFSQPLSTHQVLTTSSVTVALVHN